MESDEFQNFVRVRIMKVMTARMTAKQIEPVVDEIVNQWQNDIFEAWKLGEQAGKNR